jgi:hypothetical protein
MPVNSVSHNKKGSELQNLTKVFALSDSFDSPKVTCFFSLWLLNIRSAFIDKSGNSKATCLKKLMPNTPLKTA